MIKNYAILKEQIDYAIQNSGLDIGATYYIVKDTLTTLEHLYYAQVNKECLEESKKEEQKDNSNTELEDGIDK